MEDLQKWDKAFKNERKKIRRRQPLKNWSGMVCLKQTIRYPFRFFKGFLPQVLLGLFLNTLSQIKGNVYVVTCYFCDFNSWNYVTPWKVSKYRVFSGPRFLISGLNTLIYSVFSPNTGKYWPEKTPDLHNFHTKILKQYIISLWLFTVRL